MIPRIVCRDCTAELAAGDRFCSSCGAAVEWEAGPSRASAAQTSPSQAPSSGSGGSVRCPLCGHASDPGSSFCESCGTSLGASRPAVAKRPKPRAAGPGGLQSWKLTLGLAVVLIAAVSVFTLTRKQDKQAEAPPASAPVRGEIPGEAMKEIEALQSAVEKNPSDAPRVLRLANLLQDVKFYPRAIAMYRQYIRLQPGDPDARVDLGVTYFELSLADSGGREENMRAAMESMEQALQIKPKHQLALFNLGMVTLHTGDHDAANEWFRKCAEVDPMSETGRKAKQLLTQHPPNNS